jgi:hypothetical protein
MSVNCEGDTGFPEDVFRVARFGNQMRPVLGIVPLEIFLIWLTGIFIPGDHFIKCQRCGSPSFCSFEYNAKGNARTMHSSKRRFLKSPSAPKTAEKPGI